MSWDNFFVENREILNSPDQIKSKINELINNEMIDYYDSPLHVSAREGYFVVMEIFMNYKHLIDIDSTNIRGNTPLFYAILRNDLAMVKLLLDNGANKDGPYYSNEAPLHTASKQGNLEIVRELINRKSDVNKLDDNHDTPLHIASKRGNLEIVKLLIDNEADLNVKNLIGGTPFQDACYFGRLEVVKMLVQYGARTELSDYYKSEYDSIQDEIKNYLSTAKQMIDNRKVYPYFWVIVHKHMNRHNEINFDK